MDSDEQFAAFPEYRGLDYGDYAHFCDLNYFASSSSREPYARAGASSKRDDSRIFSDVCERLAATSFIDASAIEVAVNDGEVVLEGVVSSRNVKYAAEDIVESVFGVSAVRNLLQVKNGQWRYPEVETATNERLQRY